MKTSLLALCLFLFAYRATSAGIFDTDGEAVKNAGGAYYLIPVSGEISGGLRPTTIGNENFPSVVLDPILTNGFPVVPVDTGYKIVYYPEGGDIGADLGIVYTEGYYRLVVKDGDALIFKIKKATKNAAGIMSIV